MTEYTLEVELDVGGKSWYKVFQEKTMEELVYHINTVIKNPEWIHYDKPMRIIKTTIETVMTVPNHKLMQVNAVNRIFK